MVGGRKQFLWIHASRVLAKQCEGFCKVCTYLNRITDGIAQVLNFRLTYILNMELVHFVRHTNVIWDIFAVFFFQVNVRNIIAKFKYDSIEIN